MFAIYLGDTFTFAFTKQKRKKKKEKLADSETLAFQSIIGFRNVM